MISYRDRRLEKSPVFLDKWADVVAGVASLFPEMSIEDIYGTINAAENGAWRPMMRLGINKAMVTSDLRSLMLERFGLRKEMATVTKLKALARVSFYVWNTNRKARTWMTVHKKEARRMFADEVHIEWRKKE